jgi:hypothetical protein
LAKLEILKIKKFEPYEEKYEYLFGDVYEVFDNP